jgi:putative sterol carrier protein
LCNWRFWYILRPSRRTRRSKMDSYVRLQRLTEPSRPELATTFQRVAEILSKTGNGHPLQLQFSILDRDSEEPTPWSVTITKESGAVAQKAAKRPDVEIITAAETWWQIADGQLSPLEAFITGRLRVRGNIERAKQVFLVDLAAAPGKLPEWLR